LVGDSFPLILGPWPPWPRCHSAACAYAGNGNGKRNRSTPSPLANINLRSYFKQTLEIAFRRCYTGYVTTTTTVWWWPRSLEAYRSFYDAIAGQEWHLKAKPKAIDFSLAESMLQVELSIDIGNWGRAHYRPLPFHGVSLKVKTYRIKLPLRGAIRPNGGKGFQKRKGKLNISYRNNWGITSQEELKWIGQKQQEINQARPKPESPK
jgi:hypothetical protein